jgi:hypothetical protein
MITSNFQFARLIKSVKKYSRDKSLEIKIISYLQMCKYIITSTEV